MGSPSMEAVRAAAKEKAKTAKAAAADKMKAATLEAQRVKAIKKSPPPQYFEEPEYTGDPEADDAADLGALESGFRKRAKDEGQRMMLAGDSGYYACICFQTREQRDAWLDARGIKRLGDRFLAGQEVAKIDGVPLPEAKVPYDTSEKIDKTWLDFTD